jgi:hypothetical protein
LKLKIDNEALAEEFFEDSVLLGLVAPIKDYQLSWQVNQMLNIDFRMSEDLEINLVKKNRNYRFSMYEYKVPSVTLAHYLYNNEHEGEFLLPEFKHLDFLWLIKGDNIEKEWLQDLIQAVRMISGVQLVTEMTNEKIKNKQYLIF